MKHCQADNSSFLEIKLAADN